LYLSSRIQGRPDHNVVGCRRHKKRSFRVHSIRVAPFYFLGLVSQTEFLNWFERPR